MKVKLCIPITNRILCSWLGNVCKYKMRYHICLFCTTGWHVEPEPWGNYLVDYSYNLGHLPHREKKENRVPVMSHHQKKASRFLGTSTFSFLTISLLNGKDKDNRNIAVTQTNLHQLHSQNQIFFFLNLKFICTKI